MKESIENYAVNSARWLSIVDFDGEVWKDIPDYEGWYQVSNYGRIKSVDRLVQERRRDGKQKVKHCKACVIKGSIYGNYLVCHLKKKGTSKAVKFHRIVCSVFHENPLNLPEVNHKNEIKTDNRADNLEWCSRKYNATYGTAISRIVSQTRNHPSLSKKVYQFSMDGKPIASYPSVKEAMRATGIKDVNIRSVCDNGKSSSAGGFIWSYLNSHKDVIRKIQRKNNNATSYAKKKVSQYTKDGFFVKSFSSIKEAASATGIDKDTISRCCKKIGYYHTAGGYKWKFNEN